MIMMVFAGNLLVNNAPNGAAGIPPMIKPKMIFQFVRPIVNIKTIDSVSVTKNSEKFTDPIVFLGEWPVDIKVEVTTGPHPPPPIASQAPPTSPNPISKLVLGCFSETSGVEKALKRILIPMKNRYMAI